MKIQDIRYCLSYLLGIIALMGGIQSHADQDDAFVDFSSAPDFLDTPAIEPTDVTTNNFNAARPQWVPPGFEALNEPQMTEVDIWYGGYFLTSSLARFTFEELQFLNPEAIVEQVPNVNDADHLRDLLSQAMPTNSELVCRSTFEIDCGTLISDGVEIIFDRDKFRASLFIGPQNLSVTKTRNSRYLPDSSATLSAYSANNLYFSGAANQTLIFNFNNDTQIALAENRLLLRNNWTDSNGFVFDTIGIQRQYQGTNVEAGLIRGNAAGFEFINSDHFLGVSLGSSLSTITDLEQSLGSEIFQFFSTRSLVEIYRDNRLLYSGYYDVGNRQLETSTLPSGSYNIEIRITDILGNISIEQNFYSKSARLAPNDQPLYFFQLGNLVRSEGGSLIPEQLGQFVKAGYSARLSPTLGAGVGFSGTEDSSLIELSMFKMGKNFELSSGLAYENNDTLGVNARLRYNSNLFNFDIGTRQILNGKLPFQSGEVAQIIGSRSEYRANLNFQVPLGRINLFYRTNTREAVTITPLINVIEDMVASSIELNDQNYGIRWSFNGRKLGPGQIRASAELSRNNNASLFVLGISYNFSATRSDYSLSPRYNAGSDEAGKTSGAFEGSSSANWRMGKEEQNKLSMRAYKQDQNMIEASLQTSAFNSSNDVTARYELGSKALSYNGSFSSTFATTSDARAFGSSQNGESAFLVYVDGLQADSTEYEVLVNGSPRGKTRAGKTLLVPVAPFETYNIELVARGDTLVSLKENNYVKTVYPGNVIALEWHAKLVKVGYGRVLDANGQPLANAVLTGIGAISITDQLGYFQMEIGQDDESFELRKDSDSCIVYFNQVNTENLILPLGDLSCQWRE
jgi:hypothetical protein